VGQSDHSRGIVVLGMHRSGTSALSGILRLLGFDSGADLVRPNEFNPTGYWENRSVVRLNERILSHLGSSWSDVFLLPYQLGRTDLRAVFEAEARTLLDNALSGKRTWVLKDPRMSVLIDFWLPYLCERNVSFIHVVRHPIEVANSLERRDGFPAERGLLLWFLQNLNAEFFTRGLNRSFINYEDCIRDWRGALGDAFRQLDLSPVRSFDRATADVERFIAQGRTRQPESVCCVSSGIGCKLVEQAFETLREAGRLGQSQLGERCDELMDRFRDSSGLLLRTLAENDMRAELEEARRRIGVLASKEVALNRRVDELQKRKMLLTERDSFRIREFLSNVVWRFWWLWVPLSLIPVWIFD
jgi:hypothetical protein